MKQISIAKLCMVALIANATQNILAENDTLTMVNFDFDMTKPQPVYTEELGYGYDIVAPPDGKSNEPFYFSVKIPDGNYKVTVTLGAKKRPAITTIKAENRRLFAERIATKKGETITYSFTVNKRTPEISDGKRVRIKEREVGQFTWDDKLTLEFNGTNPAVSRIQIEPNENCTTIYLCGNSTVTDQGKEPWASWGQMITRWFNEDIAIANHAESGLTAGSFMAQNRLEQIMSTIKPGDVVICEFGHNDEKEKGPGMGAWYHYSRNLKIFVDNVRSKGASIVFCTPTQRRHFNKDKKHIDDTHGDFSVAMKAVATRENVPLIDLTTMTTTLYETLGYEESKHTLVHYPANTWPGQDKDLADNTHFNPFGAYEVAKMVVMGIKEHNLDISKNIRSDFKDFDVTVPDDWKEFIWDPSPGIDIVKPDGN